MSNGKGHYKGRRNLWGDVSTSYVANLCGVSPRTVAGWADSGKLPHTRLIPNNRTPENERLKKKHNGERRFKLKDVIAFMKAHNIPLPQELLNKSTVLVFNVESDWSYHIPLDKLLPNVVTAKNAFEFGATICSTEISDIPLAIIGDYNGASFTFQAAKELIARYPKTRIYLFLHEDVGVSADLVSQCTNVHVYKYPLNYDELAIRLYGSLTQLNKIPLSL